MHERSMLEGLKRKEVERSTPINKSLIPFAPKRSNFSNSYRAKFMVIIEVVDLTDNNLSINESNAAARKKKVTGDKHKMFMILEVVLRKMR